MKKLVLFLATVSISLSALAKDCYVFDVSKNSKGLSQLFIEVDSAAGKKTQATAYGEVGNRQVKSKFSCVKSRRGTHCVQLRGAGDFMLTNGKSPTLSLTYLNLLIGEDSPRALKANEEIHEDFAILDIENDRDDGHEDSGELDGVSLKGQKITCRSRG